MVCSKGPTVRILIKQCKTAVSSLTLLLSSTAVASAGVSTGVSTPEAVAVLRDVLARGSSSSAGSLQKQSSTSQASSPASSFLVRSFRAALKLSDTKGLSWIRSGRGAWFLSSDHKLWTGSEDLNSSSSFSFSSLTSAAAVFFIKGFIFELQNIE